MNADPPPVLARRVSEDETLPIKLLGLLEDHLALLTLESRYEWASTRIRLLAFIGIGTSILLAIIFFQMAVMDALVRIGIPLYAICTGFGLFWGITGFLIYQYAGYRDRAAGEPFAGTREELRRSFQWIRQRLS